MKKISLILLLLAGTSLLKADILFDAEKRPGNARPNCQDLSYERGKDNKTKAGTAKGNGVCLCDTAATRLPQICSDGKSGAIVCWTERYRATSDSDYDIFAQRVDSAGNILWQSQGVPVCSLSNTSAWYPKMIADGSGGAIIAWEEWGRIADGYTHVYAQRLDSLGNRLWAENGVTVCSQMSGYVDLCSDGSGGAIIAYVDGRDEAATSDNIYTQRIDSAGNPVWPVDGVPVCVADSIQFWPQITSDRLYGAIITWWQDYRNGSNNKDVYAQRINSQGLAKWLVNGLGVCIKPGNQGGGQLCENSRGGAVIRWGDTNGSYVQSLDSNGVKLWDSNGVYTVGTFGNIKPILFGGGVSNSYAAQFVDSAGNLKWGGGILLHKDTTGGQYGATTSSDEGLIVVWDDYHVNINYANQYVQKVDSNGNIMWGDSGAPACTLQMGYETYPQITSDGLGGAICTWYGTPNHIVVQNRVYVQRVYDNGAVWGIAGEPPVDCEPRITELRIYPNPFKQSTMINYQLATTCQVSLKVYNITGQLVKIIADGVQSPGIYDLKSDRPGSIEERQ